MHHFLFPAITHIVNGLPIVIFGMVLALRRKEPFYNNVKLELIGAGVGIAAFIQGVLVIISYKDPESSCKMLTTLLFSLLAGFLSFAGFMSHVVTTPS